MTHRSSISHARGDRTRQTCNVEQATVKICPDQPCSRRHIYNLFHRGDIEGYFLGQGRGLRIYIDSIEKMRRRNSGEMLLADPAEAENF